MANGYLNALLAAAKNGKTLCFGELYTEYYQSLFSYANIVLVDTNKAKSALHDCFIEIWKHIGEIEDINDFEKKLQEFMDQFCVHHEFDWSAKYNDLDAANADQILNEIMREIGGAAFSVKKVSSATENIQLLSEKPAQNTVSEKYVARNEYAESQQHSGIQTASTSEPLSAVRQQTTVQTDGTLSEPTTLNEKTVAATKEKSKLDLNRAAIWIPCLALVVAGGIVALLVAGKNDGSAMNDSSTPGYSGYQQEYTDYTAYGNKDDSKNYLDDEYEEPTDWIINTDETIEFIDNNIAYWLDVSADEVIDAASAVMQYELESSGLFGNDDIYVDHWTIESGCDENGLPVYYCQVMLAIDDVWLHDTSVQIITMFAAEDSIEFNSGIDGEFYWIYDWDGEFLFDHTSEPMLATVDFTFPEFVQSCFYYENSYNSISATHDYEIIISDASWFEAKEACEQRGGHLATITSEEEYELICNMANEYSGVIYLWLGACASDTWGDDSWITGESWTYSNWYPGEPSYYDADGTPERYLNLWHAKYNGSDIGWTFNDQRNDIVEYFPSISGLTGYVCEYD